MKLLSRFAIALLLIGSIAAIFYITGNKVNQYGASDPLLSLPTSQALWRTGHVYLDQHSDEVVLLDGKTLGEIPDDYRVAQVPKGTVDYFPAGPAILTLPLTAVLQSIGYDFVDPNVNLGVQNRLAFITSTVALLLLFVLCRLWLPPWEALIITLGGFFGSIIFSTLGSAFWSINYTVIFNFAVLILLSAKQTIFKDGRYHTAIGIALGILLFLSFFCRVSSVAIIVCTLAYLLITDFRQAVISGATAFVCLLAFAFWSFTEYDLILPPYYALNRLDDAPVPMWVGLYGNLVSPSRGIFVFMPWLLLPIGWIIFRPSVWRDKFVLYASAWFVLQLVIASRAVIWWGGGSFGPRLLVEAMPALILLTLIAWHNIKDSQFQYRNWMAGGFIFIATFSIWVHSWQAFFNPYTAGHWYAVTPAVVSYSNPSELGPYFDWSYTQWLSNDRIVCELDQIHFTERIIPHESTLEPINIGTVISHISDKNQDFNERAMLAMLTGEAQPAFAEGTGNQALFQGMYIEKDDGRWSGCPEAKIYFLLNATFPEADFVSLELQLAALDAQTIEISINEQSAIPLEIGAAPQTYQVVIDSSWLNRGELNSIEFEIPSRRKPTQKEVNHNGPLGIQLIEFKLEN